MDLAPLSAIQRALLVREAARRGVTVEHLATRLVTRKLDELSNQITPLRGVPARGGRDG